MVHREIAILFFLAVVSCDQRAKEKKQELENCHRASPSSVDEKAKTLRSARKIAPAFVDGNWDVVFGSMDRRFYEQLGASQETMNAKLANKDWIATFNLPWLMQETH
ncbi:MAG: hypothetical protein GY899_01485 [Verrucomicrobiaceae bacterium]|nr:hypothetical protein [Verrucomicrobiaceae bacterium]